MGSDYAQRKWLGAKEVREIYGISPALLNKLEKQKQIICRRPGGWKKIYQVKSLEGLLK